MLWSNPKNITGIDVGAEAVRLVQLQQHHHGYDATAAAEAAIPPAGDDEETNTLKERCVDSLRRCVSSLGFHISRKSWCIGGLGWPHVSMADFEMPEMPKALLEESLISEAEHTCPFAIKDAVLDYQITGTTGSGAARRFRGFYIAALNDAVEERYAIVKNSGLDCIIMDVDWLGLLNCYRGVFDSDQTQRAVVELGMNRTVVVVPQEKKMPFARNLTSSGSNIVTIIAREKDISGQQAKELLLSREYDSTLKSIISKSSLRLVRDVSQTLRYFMVENSISSIDEVLVTGDLSGSPEIIDALDNEFDADVRCWNPFETIKVKSKCTGAKLLEENGSAFAVAAGYAMRSAYDV
ncbi:type IV pilus assembly protein PilM [Limihaloglobus sulfuriphilus]|uniref:Type IV pilus assembly protein PilM n=1 Tax=Limihaloglobus sulfuriphilus TaxID=1851148 RepID=A0A1Q2MIB3_9BACT|nr:pilus assembly protein PilM [Limihaloglobus sulfuriphilus]AQQ72002.1 type IV pilus assembly protein PilM [Limihaloglobus sulfuriphilus]